MADLQRLILFNKMEDFIDWFEPIVNRFPVREKHALCALIKKSMYRMIRIIIETNCSEEKSIGWKKLDVEKEVLKYYIRHSFKEKFISSNSYETAAKKMLEIGKIIGGLLKKGN